MRPVTCRYGSPHQGIASCGRQRHPQHHAGRCGHQNGNHQVEGLNGMEIQLLMKESTIGSSDARKHCLSFNLNNWRHLSLRGHHDRIRPLEAGLGVADVAQDQAEQTASQVSRHRHLDLTDHTRLEQRPICDSVAKCHLQKAKKRHCNGQVRVAY